jgi:hypothetical protein
LRQVFDKDKDFVLTGDAPQPQMIGQMDNKRVEQWALLGFEDFNDHFRSRSVRGEPIDSFRGKGDELTGTKESDSAIDRSQTLGFGLGSRDDSIH